MLLLIIGAEGAASESIVAALRRIGTSVVLVDLQSRRSMVEALSAAGGNDAGHTVIVYFGIDADGHATEMDLAGKVADFARSAAVARIVMVGSCGVEGLLSHGQERDLAILGREGIDTEILLIPARVDAMPQSSGRLLGPSVDTDQIGDAIVQAAHDVERDGFRIVTAEQSANGVFGISKRMIDIGLSLAVVLALWWLMLVVWLLVRWQSPGPGIFAQQRVGKGEKVFTCYKFRTMYLSTPDLGTHELTADAVTPIGRVLRGTKIDELPQVLNVLRGEMSFVGPRPCLPNQIELIDRRRARGIFDIVPGITGLAQVAKVDMSDPLRLANWDYRYLKLRCLPLDLIIMLRTILGKGGGDRTSAGSVVS